MTTCPGPRGNSLGMRKRTAAGPKGATAHISLISLFFLGAKGAWCGETWEADRWGRGSWRRKAVRCVSSWESWRVGGVQDRTLLSHREAKHTHGEGSSTVAASPWDEVSKGFLRGLGPACHPAEPPAAPGPPPWRCFGAFSLGCLLPDILDVALSAGRLRGLPVTPQDSLPPSLPSFWGHSRLEQGSMGGIGTLAQPPNAVLSLPGSQAGYPNRFARWRLWLKATFAPGVSF